MPHKFPIRSMCGAPPGKRILAFDLSQAESWIVAYRANSYNMKMALTKGDIHSLTALMINDMKIPTGEDMFLYSLKAKGFLTEETRYGGKKTNHSTNYKQSAGGMADAINLEGLITVSHKQTKKWQRQYLDFYGIEPWWMEVEEKLRVKRRLTNGYGFTRTFHSPIGQELYRKGIAFDPQSTIADHTYGAVHKDLGIEGGLKQVVKRIIKPSKGELELVQSAHDSGMIYFPESWDVLELAGRVRELMERPLVIEGEMFTIPSDYKVGGRWEEYEKLKVA